MTEMPFRPVADDFAGWPMPPSVPAGIQVELSRARLLDSAEARFDEWMQMLNDRYAEAVATLEQEKMALEATFVNQEHDGSWWMYHLAISAADSPGLQLNNDLDRTHYEFAVATKHAGWEELRPRFMLATPGVRAALEGAAGLPADDPDHSG